MLVLSRKVGEQVCIGNDVIVSVVDVYRGRVRLGIKAPQHVQIRRSELLMSEQGHVEGDGDAEGDGKARRDGNAT